MTTRLCKAVSLGVLTGVLGLTASLLPFGYDLEEGIGLGLLFKLRGERPAPPDVVVIAVDRASANELNLPPDPKQWGRSYHARLTQKLADEGASVIAFDLMFDEARSAAEDRAFAEAIRAARNVVLLGYLERETIALAGRSGRVTGGLTVDRMRPPAPALAREAASVAPLPLPKVPVTVSQFWTFSEGAGGLPTLPVTAFQLFALQAYDDLVGVLQKALEHPRIAEAGENVIRGAAITEAQRLVNFKREDFEAPGAVYGLIRSLRAVLGNSPVFAEIMLRELENPMGPAGDDGGAKILKPLLNMYLGGNSRYLNFYGPPRTITTVPYFQALRLPQPVVVNGREVDFRGKTVFIGASDLYPYQQGDTYRTVFSQPNGLDLSGVEIGATAFANLLEDFPVRPIDFRAALLTILLFGIAVGSLCLLLRPLLALVCSVGLIAACMGIAYYLFKMAGVWVPVIIPLGIQAPFALVAAVSWKYFDTRKLEAAHKQLQEVDRLKSMFLSHVSHELKTPLTSIKGFVDNMLDGVLGEPPPKCGAHREPDPEECLDCKTYEVYLKKQQDYLSRIRANTDRLSRMITNLLDLSRIESGTHRLDRVPLRLFDLVVEVVEQFRPMATCKGMTLEMVCPDPTIRALADPDKFIQVLTNLVDNAIKYTPPGGKVTVTMMRRDPEHVLITVTDTGEGIRAEAMPKLFEPFYQASQQPGTRAKGLGLGLSIVKTLVELHGGTITVTSEVGKGSEFCILMPVLAQKDT
ncbi:MAG: ATP-binding protein [Nitrospirota bacterium]